MEHVAFEGDVFSTKPTMLPRRQKRPKLLRARTRTGLRARAASARPTCPWGRCGDRTRCSSADRARALLETAKALAKARPGADASDFAAAASALADGHPSQAVRGLAAQFEASLPTTAPVKKTKKKRKSAK